MAIILILLQIKKMVSFIKIHNLCKTSLNINYNRKVKKINSLSFFLIWNKVDMVAIKPPLFI